MYEPHVMFPFLVQANATEADLTGFLKQLHGPLSRDEDVSGFS
jgi:hypothetical protein